MTPWLLIVGLFAALVANTLPLGPIYGHIHPDFLALLVLYWALTQDRGVSYLAVWAIGLLQDLILGNPLGTQAMALVTMVFLLYLGIQRVRALPPWEQLFFVLLLLLANRLVSWLWLLWAGPISWHWTLLLGPALGTALWPVITLSMDYLYQRWRRRGARRT